MLSQGLEKNRYGTAESVMCDVIKIRLKRRDEMRSGKKISKKKETYFIDIKNDIVFINEFTSKEC